MWFDEMMITDWITAIATVFSAIAAAITAWAVWQQRKINQQQLDLGLYEKRLRVFNEVKNIIGKNFSSFEEVRVAIENFNRSIKSEALFLFSPEISEYIEKIGTAKMNFEKSPRTDESSKDIGWLNEQHDGGNYSGVEKVFSNYLNLNRKFDSSKRKTGSVTG